ncbi:hypothetical protein RFI_34054 [Reticulomyxa filosa]|uniref:Uncharacterized protein n=1 Tax=Reticulomyxa filosa TaxID=46433 RepID=X6LPR0_RETFI|nr:hypothetical protein RFI_34054 [Reticulomyxa filosa]|eukprot:ETO03356.1 hypothetical protein RFI_34054 [Reticulomyxa filosa]
MEKINYHHKISFCVQFFLQPTVYHWIRTLNIQLGWIKNFDKFIVNYVSRFVYSFFKYQSIFKYLFNRRLLSSCLTHFAHPKLINLLTFSIIRIYYYLYHLSDFNNFLKSIIVLFKKIQYFKFFHYILCFSK